MSLRQLSKTAVIRALKSAPAGPYERLLEVLADDPREEFTTTEAPAFLLRENLDPKHRIARSRGKAVRGDAALLVALTDLGIEPVTGIFIDHKGEHIALYLRAATLEPVGCVVIGESEPS